MKTISLNEAQLSLTELVQGLVPGEVVNITVDDQPIAQIVQIPAIGARPPRPRAPVTGVPRAGSVPGLCVPADFKAPLEELQDYTE